MEFIKFQVFNHYKNIFKFLKYIISLTEQNLSLDSIEQEYFSHGINYYANRYYSPILIIIILLSSQVLFMTIHTEKICRLKSHRLCIILVDRLESRLNIMSLLIEEYDR